MSAASARPWIIMALIFILGGVTGSLLTIGFGSHGGPTPPPGPTELRDHRMHFLTWRLHLTNAQQTQIQPIITDAESRIHDKYRDDVGTISGIMKDANEKIRAVLTPEQQAEFDKMESERERMFRSHLHGSGDFHHDHGPGGFHGPGPGRQPPGPPPGAPAQSPPNS